MHSNPSLEAVNLTIHEPVAERFRETMKTCRAKKASAAVWKTFAVAVAAIAASSVAAQTSTDPDYFVAPAAHTQAEAYVNGVRQAEFAVDAQLLGDLGDLLPRISISSLLGSSAYAEASKNRYAARAYSNGGSSSAGFAHWLFIARDPSGRAEVRLNLKAKASANAAYAGDTGYNSARFIVTVCLPGSPGAIWYDALGHLTVGPPQCGGIRYPYRAYGNVRAGKLIPGGETVKTIEEFGVPLTVEGTGASVSMDINYDVAVIPGLPYLITVMASAGSDYGGAAVSTVDPVLEPASVNPDVTIEFPNLALDPNPPPLMGDLTPEALAAAGLDPQPFVDLGFFDPPSAPPPPPPVETPPFPVNKDWCGPGFWFNNAAKFGASAWPATVPTYYDYNSTAGQIAGCPIASNNPTLLQVLQSPDPYFGSNPKGTGFNCVGDYLSAQSGLGGTKIDNSGVCPIDQLGQRK